MVIPSISLVNGMVARMTQGEEKSLVRGEPLELAREFDRYGEMAVIDLDAECAKDENIETIREILRVAECRVGGGITTVEKAKELISCGAKKIIIGSKVFEDGEVNHEFLSGLVQAIGEHKIIIAADVLDGHGTMRDKSSGTVLNLFNVVHEIEEYASELLIRCVDKVDALECMELVRKLRGMTHNRVTLAADTTSVDQIKELSEIGVDVQLDAVLQTGRIDLAEAFIESLNWKSADCMAWRGATTNELVPTITQDRTGQILTLAYSSKDSVRKTFETGKMWYFSRSRNRLWMKGETSGNTQRFVRIRGDCDRDALLATVEQEGSTACHTGSYSCFGDRRFSLSELYEVVKNRIEHPTPESYTAKLTDESLREKILEEAREVVAAKGRDEVVWEAADVLYFLTVLLAKNGVEIEDVLFELARRRKG